MRTIDRRAAFSRLPVLFLLAFSFIATIVVGVGVTVLRHFTNNRQVVVVYTSQDQEYAEPIFNEFSREYRVEVRAVYDNEAAKTVGLVNRLIAEKNNPQCNVFWNNEELRTRQLARDGIVATNWVAFGFRTRRLVVNTNLLPFARAPKDVLSLTNKQFFGKVAVAYPLFGTTSAHFLALRQRFGDIGWENWCRALAANKPFVVDGNSVVVKMVGKGEATVGLTDSDDVLAGQREGLPVDSVLLKDDGFVIRNTAAIADEEHLWKGAMLKNYLESRQVLEKLQAAGAVEPDIATPTNTIEWDDLLANQNKNLEFLKGLFLR